MVEIAYFLICMWWIVLATRLLLEDLEKSRNSVPSVSLWVFLLFYILFLPPIVIDKLLRSRK